MFGLHCLRDFYTLPIRDGALHSTHHSGAPAPSGHTGALVNIEISDTFAVFFPLHTHHATPSPTAVGFHTEGL